jgi:hypothetical protein
MTISWDGQIMGPNLELSIRLKGLPGPLTATIEKGKADKLYFVHISGLYTSDDVLDFHVGKLDVGKLIVEIYFADYLAEFSKAREELQDLLIAVDRGSGIIGRML